MGNKYFKSFISSSLLLILFIGLCARAHAININGAFDKSDSKLEQAYIDAYLWDKGAISSTSWMGSDGNEHYKHSFGYQKEAYDDTVEALIAQLQLQGYRLDLSDDTGDDISSAKRARGMVGVALAEVGAERSYETPPDSNNVYYNTWFYGHEVQGSDYVWCAVFLSWCANECGYIDSGLFNKTDSCSAMYSYLTNTQGFSTHRVSDVCQLGGSYEPAAGDIVFYLNGTGFTHAGLITDTSQSSIAITQGNCSNRVCTVSYSKDNLKSNKTLYNGYIVHVEYPAFSFDCAGGEIQDTVFLFLTRELGLCSAAACALMGNFQVECAWNLAAVGDGGTSYGLCQWHNERWQSLISFCASNGYDAGDCEGQLRYLEYELTSTSESAVMSYLRSIPDNESGSRDAALYFAKHFERCSSDSYSMRQSYAATFYQIYGDK